MYHPALVPRDVDISFLGLKNKGREETVSFLEKSGLELFVSGNGWGRGKLGQGEFVTMLSRSKINLNLNNTRSLWELYSFGRLFFRRSTTMFVPSMRHPADNIRSWLNMRILQIKARPFEVSGCGGFCISGRADDIENYYVPDKEMVFYENGEDLAEKIRFYLSHPVEREAIAKAGYERTVREHTAEKRFASIFKEIGL